MSTLSDIGEFGLIEFIRSKQRIPEELTGIGDDCAIIGFDNQELLVTVDTMVEGVHFLSGTNPMLLGRKAVSVNISDIAAMGGVPRWMFLSLSIRPDASLDYIRGIIDGITGRANEFGVLLLGGDTVAAGELVLSVTMIGLNQPGSSLKRSGASPGDDIYVTGRIGCSGCGLEAIIRNLDGYDQLKIAHLDPVPRLKEALAVKDVATAMIDVSDGLLQDCWHICRSSSAGAELFMDQIPFCECDLLDEHSMLSAGEDYELLFTADPSNRDRLDRMPGITRIGVMIEEEGMFLVKAGERIRVSPSGFTHF